MRCRYICGADALHWLFIGTDSLLRHFLSLTRWHPYFTAEFKKAYPHAKVYTVADAAAKMPSDINFDGGEFLIAITTGSTVLLHPHVMLPRSVWGRDPPETKYEFEDEVRLGQRSIHLPSHR
jgi:hypothetical protein